jgi:hypothetical protein
VEARRLRARPSGVFAASAALACAAFAIPAAPAGAQPMVGTTSAWCSSNGAGVVGWTGTSTNIPICGPAPNEGGTLQYVTIPGPYGSTGLFFNATTGFQCVELAERYLALADGLAPVLANGQQVAASYHAAYPDTSLYVNGSAGAVGHAPLSGDVISFSFAPGFDAFDNGHVAVVSSSSVNARTGDGTVTIAQENVGVGYYRYTIVLERWRLVDPNSPPDALFGFPYAEWLHVTPYRDTVTNPSTSLLNRAEFGGVIRPVQAILLAEPAGIGRPTFGPLRHQRMRR